MGRTLYTYIIRYELQYFSKTGIFLSWLKCLNAGKIQVGGGMLQILQDLIYFVGVQLLFFLVLVEELFFGAPCLQVGHHTEISANDFEHAVEVQCLLGGPLAAGDFLIGVPALLADEGPWNLLYEGCDGTSIPLLSITVHA